MLVICRRLALLCLTLFLASCGGTAAGSVSTVTSSVSASVTATAATTSNAAASTATARSVSPSTSAASATSVSSATTSSVSAATTLAPTTVRSSSPSTSSTAAASGSTRPATTTYPLTVTDDHGTRVTFARQPTHVVSLAPSSTEILYAVGRGDALVAGTQYDNYPPAAKAKALIKGLKPSLETIVSYSPDLVLATSSNSAQLIQQLEATKISVLTLDPKDFAGVYHDILLVGQVLNSQAEAQQVVAGMQAKVQQVMDTTAHVATRPRVFDEIDATDPTKPFTAGPGSFIDTLITDAGGVNVAHDAKTQYPQFSLEALIAANPQIIVLQDGAYGVTAASVSQRTGWSTFAAVQEHHIYDINDDLVSRAGPRLADGLVAMAKIIHPELFP